MRDRRRRLGVALCVALVLTACAGGNNPSAGDASRLGKKDAGSVGGAGDTKGANKAGKRGPGGTGSVQTGTAGGSGAASGTGDAGTGTGGAAGSAPDTGIDPTVARASASVEEPTPDAQKQGIAPSYPEVLGASIEGLGKDFRVTIEFDGSLPQRMDDDKTFMIVAVGISYGDEGYQVGARGDKDGWKPYAGGKFDSVEFPGTFEIEGDRMIMVVPWKFIRGPREFEWYILSAWYKQLANTTHYSSDQVPNDGTTHFPN